MEFNHVSKGHRGNKLVKMSHICRNLPLLVKNWTNKGAETGPVSLCDQKLEIIVQGTRRAILMVKNWGQVKKLAKNWPNIERWLKIG